MNLPTYFRRKLYFEYWDTFMEEHPQAHFIIETLNKAGFVAYYAGGFVRDLLLQRPSDDIDIATNAPPETVQVLFPHTVPIGISFGIILVIIDEHQYEVATFRRDLDYHDGRRPTRIVFATAEEDAKRRDFTINGMFYDPLNGQIFDYVGGRADLSAGIIRAIGDPNERIKEDRLRMVRGVRLACRFGFRIDPATESAIRAHATELFPSVAVERVMQEFAKGLAFGSLGPMLRLLHELGLLAGIFPQLESVSLGELDERLEPLSRYPQGAPLIAFLLLLFPSYHLADQVDLCKRLKVSRCDQEFVAFLHRVKEATADGETVERVVWAHLYADPLCSIALQIVAAHQEKREAEDLLRVSKEKELFLCEAIDRIRRKDPVVSSEDLKKEGISPGKTMGILLREAERICCNEQIYEAAPILERLRHSPLWDEGS